MRGFIHSTYKSFSEALLPPLSQSQFKEKGVLTPQEFVQAGDFLVQTCPTWAWEAGDPQTQKAYLPKDKQYLITRNVPCLQRASAVESYAAAIPSMETNEEVEGGEWVATSSGTEDEAFEELPPTSGFAGRVRDIGDEEEEDDARAQTPASPETEEHPIPDISDLDLNAEEEEDDAIAPRISAGAPLSATVGGGVTSAEPTTGVLQTRTYDVLISYDKHYQVPRVWLVGYSESKAPLTQDEVLEDVMSDYYSYRDRKTVSVENHPHRVAGGKVVSIHPCRHADVMKRLSGVVAGDSGDFKVEHYMVLFLKFISSVVPTVEYDFTMPAGM